MDNELNRLKKLSGLEVADELVSDDDEDELENQRFESKRRLEKTVGKVIVETFKKIGFEIQEADNGVVIGNWSYDCSFDSDTNEGSVVVENCTAKQVSVLQTSGLSDDYTLYGLRGSIRIEFIVSENVINTFANAKG